MAGAFGPLMVVWFAALTLSGIVSIVQVPSVIKAVNPYYAVHFMSSTASPGFFVLSEVILCATGGEALYADMGHLGREPIVRAWYFVFFALVLNYLGQGAFLIRIPKRRTCCSRWCTIRRSSSISRSWSFRSWQRSSRPRP